MPAATARAVGFHVALGVKGRAVSCHCYSRHPKSSEERQNSEVNRLIEMESEKFSEPKGGWGDEMYETKQNK